MAHYERLPDNLPTPVDDGRADHLLGRRLPAVRLLSTASTAVDLSALSGRTVLYVYPMTGRPGVALPDGWDTIPGARGCTPESCGFRDHYGELMNAGVDAVYGVSSQTSDEQREAVERLHLPFPLLSDPRFALAEALTLPTFTAEDRTFHSRLTLIAQDNRLEHVFYPVFPPDDHAEEVLTWLRGSS